MDKPEKREVKYGVYDEIHNATCDEWEDYHNQEIAKLKIENFGLRSALDSTTKGLEELKHFNHNLKIELLKSGGFEEQVKIWRDKYKIDIGNMEIILKELRKLEKDKEELKNRSSVEEIVELIIEFMQINKDPNKGATCFLKPVGIEQINDLARTISERVRNDEKT